MRIVLAEIGCTRQEFNEPLGVESIAGAIQHYLAIRPELAWLKAGDELDLTNVSHSDVVGISLQIDSLARFDEVYQRLLAMPTTPHLVLGNLLPTYAPDEVLTRYPSAVCILSEGETAFTQLCDGWRESPTPSLQAIPNLAYLNETGHLVVTERRLENLGARRHHPLRDLIPTVLAHGGIARIEASRGCHWGRCDFCSVAERHGMGVWRPFDIDWVVDELAALSSLGIRSPYFADEDFFGKDYKRATELAHEIIAAKRYGKIDSGMNFFISMLASDIHSGDCVEALQWLRAAGLREVFVGVEAGDNLQLRRYGKKARSEPIRMPWLGLGTWGSRSTLARSCSTRRLPWASCVPILISWRAYG